MGWFSRKPCAACAAKDAHIEGLKAQIEDLRRMAFPPTPEVLLSDVAREADLILNPDTPTAELEAAAREEALLTSGNFDRWNVDLET